MPTYTHDCDTCTFLATVKVKTTLRYRLLQEVWQRGYSLEYRLGRFKEAFYPLLGEPWED